MALKFMFDQKLKKMTIGSNALGYYKELMTASKFLHYFPLLDKEIDEDLRQAYRRRIYLS